MRKVSVVARANGKNSQPIEHDTDRDGQPGDSGPDRRNAGQMHQHERNCRRIHDVIMLVVGCIIWVGFQIGHEI